MNNEQWPVANTDSVFEANAKYEHVSSEAKSTVDVDHDSKDQITEVESIATEKKSKIKVDLDASIEKLEKKLAQAKALKAQKEAAIKHAQKQIERRDNDRRKYLTGAFILSTFKGDKLEKLYNNLHAYYKRADEKRLFDFQFEPIVEQNNVLIDVFNKA